MLDLKDFTKLKDVKFNGSRYGKKNFIEKRYISKDKKFYISSDNGFNYTLVYIANNEGKGLLLDELYKHGNYSSYPIYTVEQAIEKLNKHLETSKVQYSNLFLIHSSQYKRKLKSC